MATRATCSKCRVEYQWKEPKSIFTPAGSNPSGFMACPECGTMLRGIPSYPVQHLIEPPAYKYVGDDALAVYFPKPK